MYKTYTYICTYMFVNTHRYTCKTTCILNKQENTCPQLCLQAAAVVCGFS